MLLYLLCLGQRYSQVGDARPGQKYSLLLDCDGPY